MKVLHETDKNKCVICIITSHIDCLYQFKFKFLISGGGFFSSMEQQTQRIMEKFKIHGVKRKYMSYVIELYESINIEYFIIQCSD